jgi:predicted outer membrane repeat protein
MWFSSWLGHRADSGKQRPVKRFRPRFEALEGRCVLSTLTVTNNLDSGHGSLRAEIGAAKSGDVINFAPGLSGQTIKLTSGELSINKSLSIQGPGAGLLAISGGNTSRVFEVLHVAASFSGMTIEGGNAFVGGGIANQYHDGAMTIDNCTITGNSATSEGGGIYSQSAISLTHSVVSGNSAAAYGGGIFNYTAFGGLGLAVSNSTISGNTAGGSGGAGGGIYNSGPLTVTDCTLNGNSASAGSGGAVYNYAGSFTIQSSTVSGNRARADGGGVGFFSTSTSQIGTIQSCTLAKNSASHGGGVNSHGTLKLLGSTLSGNAAAEDGTVYGTTGARGGGLYNFGNVAVTDCTFTSNSASLGGGIYMDVGSLRTIAGCTFTNNVAVQGGGIYHYWAGITVSNTSFTGNSATQGGGIYNTSGYVTLVNCGLSGNSASDSGGGVFNAVSCSLICQGSTLLNNSAPLGADLYNLGTVSIDSSSTIGVIDT